MALASRSEQINRQGVIRLREDGCSVQVETRREDRFVLTAVQAVAGCVFINQYEDMLATVRNQGNAAEQHIQLWCQRHPRVESAHFGVAPDRSGIVVVLLVAGESRAVDFEDDVSDLELVLAREFPSLNLSVVMLPSGRSGDLSPYLGKESSELLYDKAGSPQKTG